jgi:glycosyltransferase involved in cell wall biosynthesis
MFMSVEEGFGLPVIEARARGLPVLISEIPVFRDLKLDELVTYANPRSVEDIAHGLAGMITKAKKIPSKEYFSQYDWRSVADLVLAEATRNN